MILDDSVLDVQLPIVEAGYSLIHLIFIKIVMIYALDSVRFFN